MNKGGFVVYKTNDGVNDILHHYTKQNEVLIPHEPRTGIVVPDGWYANIERIIEPEADLEP